MFKKVTETEIRTEHYNKKVKCDVNVTGILDL